MKYDANDYLKRQLIGKEGMTNQLINLYSTVLRDLVLKPTDIFINSNNSMIISTGYQVGQNKQDNKTIQLVRVDDKNNLLIQINLNSNDSKIQYNIGYDGIHYEISILNNCYLRDNHDKYSGIYYINKNINGIITYKFYDYSSYGIINRYNKYEEKCYYNPNYFYINGFNPDHSFEIESNSQFNVEQLATELNELLNNVSVDYSNSLFKKCLYDYEEHESEMNYILK